MAKKHGPNWKKALRAEVAAAMQNKTEVAVPAVVQHNPVAVSSNSPRAIHTKMTYDKNATLIVSDLRRIGFVAAVLFALLITAAITDRNTGWLNQATDSLTRTLTQ